MLSFQAVFMNFKEKLKKICELEGINLKEFSNLSEISYGVVKSYSSGRREPTLAQLVKISGAPRLAKYKSMLLSLNEEPPEDAEFKVLYDKACELGREDEVLQYLRFVASQQPKK